MSDHLPECDEAWKWPDFMSGRGIEDSDCWMCGLLRRVRADERQNMALQYLVSDREQQEAEQRSYALGIEVGKHDGWISGHAAGVQAARDAVAAVFASKTPLEYHAHLALAAIDGLRGDGSLTSRNVTASDLAAEQRNEDRDDRTSANADAHVNVSERRLGDIPTPHDAAESPLYDGAWHRDLYGDADGLRGME